MMACAKGDAMKRAMILIIVLVFAAASVLFAAEPAKPGPRFEQIKARHLENLEANIKRDQDLKICFEKAQSPADMRVCRGKKPRGAGAAGPKFAAQKTKILAGIDERIKLREARRDCIAKAADHAAMQSCPVVRGGR
jgi:hypothetical protein